jgi:hypothetical protein
MDESDLSASFPDFTVQEFFTVGHKQRTDEIYRTLLRHRLVGYRRLAPHRQCPLCGQFGSDSGECEERMSVSQLEQQLFASRAGLYGVLRRAALRLVPGRERWLGCLLRRA